MQLHEELGLLYSPTDLVTFLACRHASYLDRLSLKEPLEKTGDSRTNQLLQKMGLEHEKAYLQSLRAEGRSVAGIPGGPDLLRRAALTREAMERGVDVIYQGVFLAPPWRGDADFLMKCDRPSRFGAYGYEVVDTKLARTGEPKHVIQLCVYSDMLADVQDVRPEGMSLRLGTGESCRFLLDDFFHYYRHARQGFEQFQLEQPASTMPTPEPCGYCGFCRWSDRCKAQWEAEDHLSRIANIQRSQVARLEAAGIGSLAALASTAPDAQVPGLAPALFHRLRAQAILQHHKADTGQDRYELLPASAGKGFARIPLPDEGDLFFDMEGDPLYPGGLEYLFGLYYREGGQERFLPFWAHDHAGEKEAFRQFMAFLADHLARYPRAHIYHYNHYETTALKRLSCRHACCEEQLDELLKRGVFVDLYVVVRESIRTSESGYSIKNLETFYMEKRANAVANAAESIVVYNEWRETHDPSLLQAIAAYNEVDCHSTLLLRDWLLSLRPEEQVLASPVEEDAGTGEELPLPRRDEDVEHEVMLERLAGGEGESALVRERLSHLLEFHRREAKPQWWGLYDRQTRYDDELLDDAECLVGLQQVGDAEPEKRSLIYSYRFPSQDCKLKVGVKPLEIATLRGAGTVVELDERARLVRLKLGATQPPLPRHLSLGPAAPVDGKPLRGALYRYAARLLAEPDRPCVATEILARNRPKIRGRRPGERLVAPEDMLGETFRAVEGLEDSYLFIQGPPGAGKTYTCSHVILALIRQGRKVGITSNSHKAIHNLLEKIEAVAMEQGVTFRGIKKASSSSVESVYKSAFTTSVYKTEQIDLTANLFASTAWGFTHSHFEGQLDYLFIDEAGQVATANVIGMAGATRNIILVGVRGQK